MHSGKDFARFMFRVLLLIAFVGIVIFMVSLILS